VTAPPVLLGTPLSPAATRVLLLGAGELGKEVIIALQRLGVEVIAADATRTPPVTRWRTAPSAEHWPIRRPCAR